MLKLKVKNRSLCLLQAYAPNAVNECEAFVDDVDDALQQVESTESAILMENFNAHTGTDLETRRGMIGKQGYQSWAEFDVTNS